MIGYFGDTDLQEEEAKQILTILWWAYPGHPWFVRVYEGGFFIRHLDFKSQWGMNCKTKDIFSASQMKHEIIMKAGEWLDRAGIPRSRYDSDNPDYRVEGVPERFQPGQVVGVEDVVLGKSDFRSEPRPQVLKETDVN